MKMLRKTRDAVLRVWPAQRARSREELAEIIEESFKKDVSFDKHERMLLTNILGLRDIKVEDVMVPRADIVCVDISDGARSVMKTVTEANHSRVPVFKSNLDDVVGFLHVKDVSRAMADGGKPKIEGMLRQPLFISPAMRALDLLQEMRLKRLHIALVVDEYGGIDGLITIEDLVEEIVGEINDEHDEDSTPVLKREGKNTVKMAARVEIGKLEEISGVVFDGEEMEEIDTVGGLVTLLAGRVPDRGEIIRHPSGLEFEILESHPRHVGMVRIGGLARKEKGAKPKGKPRKAKKSA